MIFIGGICLAAVAFVCGYDAAGFFLGLAAIAMGGLVK